MRTCSRPLLVQPLYPHHLTVDKDMDNQQQGRSNNMDSPQCTHSMEQGIPTVQLVEVDRDTMPMEA